MGTVVRNLFALLRYELNNSEIAADVKADITPESLQKLYVVSKAHDLMHLISDALYKNGLLIDDDPSCENMSKSQLMAIYQTERQDYELKNISLTFEENKIPFIPLKGSVLRGYYPESWQRTSCDIDILVHESDLKRASEILVEKHQYRVETKRSHDWSLFSMSGIHLELHFDTIERSTVSRSEEVLSKIWDHASVAEGSSYKYVLDDEMFYFYHIAHMAKHFQIGGCGVRPLIDLWVLNHRIKFDKEKRNDLLEVGGLLKFAEASENLSEVWMEGVEADSISKMMQNLILNGGLFGKTETRVKLQQQKKGGKFKYLLLRIWLPYDDIKLQYSILLKYPVLLPVIEVIRWFKLIFCGGIKRSVNEMKINNALSKEEEAQTAYLLNELGLLKTK